ncbi:hypothetical protein [Sphingopyxis sp. RIFCSPHIGHO2_12_FULL_65_19]|uniref:hypothetical protein n=1 Tax=Sphingopyxis sp. RIFCSPHIGHO2_12_FULL_65_19 TaxID=1802172 RepID=UPI000A702EE8|nr:hypothetical protein [Sphingopyxis sp. RIFCSPHIGHO2_12_FULL_65_19]
MTGGSALGARAIGDVARRDLASEWSGPAPAAAQVAVPVVRETGRRIILRKP